MTETYILEKPDFNMDDQIKNKLKNNYIITKIKLKCNKIVEEIDCYFDIKIFKSYYSYNINSIINTLVNT